MAWASDAWGSGAWGGSGDADVASAPTLAEILAAEHQVFAVVITLPLLAGGSTTIYWSDRYYASKASDTPASTEFEPVIIGLEDESAVNISPRNSADNSISGRLRVQDVDGAIEELFDGADYTKRKIEIYVGRSAGKAWPDAADDPFAWFRRIGTFTINDVSSDGEVFEIAYRDRSYELDVAAQNHEYAGTGTYEGDGNIVNQPKPLIGGFAYFVDLQLVDPVYLIYQMHDGIVPQYDYVQPLIWDNGIQISIDSPASTNLYGETIAAGHVKIDRTRGFVRFGSTPAGRVCAQFYGLHTTRQAYYQSSPEPHFSHPDVIRALISRRLPSFPIDVSSFDALGDSLLVFDPEPFPYDDIYWEDIASIVVEPGQTLSECCNVIANSAGLSLWMTFDGDLRIGRLSKPVLADVVAEFDPGNIMSMSREKLPESLWPPPYRIEMLGWKVQSWPQAGNIASGASDGIKQRLTTNRFNYHPVSDADIAAKFSNAVVWSKFDAYAQDPLTIEALGQHMLETHGGSDADGTIFKRLFLHLRVPKTGLALEPYSTIKITWPRYGLDTGKLFVAWPAGRNMVVDSEPTTVDLLAWGGFEP